MVGSESWQLGLSLAQRGSRYVKHGLTKREGWALPAIRASTVRVNKGALEGGMQVCTHISICRRARMHIPIYTYIYIYITICIYAHVMQMQLDIHRPSVRQNDSVLHFTCCQWWCSFPFVLAFPGYIWACRKLRALPCEWCYLRNRSVCMCFYIFYRRMYDICVMNIYIYIHIIHYE